MSTDEIDDEELDKMIVNDEYEYSRNPKLGEKVYKSNFQTWLSLLSIAVPISHRREIWKGILIQNMKWSTSDLKGVNSQQLTKISLENIHSQSIIREVPRMFCRVQ